MDDRDDNNSWKSDGMGYSPRLAGYIPTLGGRPDPADDGQGQRSLDERYKERVERRIERDGWMAKADIRVSVERGIATLSGTAPTQRIREDAEKMASSVPGIYAVQNDIELP